MDWSRGGLTIRESTEEEQRDKWPPLFKDRDRIEIPKYVVCLQERPENIVSVFGLPQGGDTKEEAVFWAERAASKNGYDYVAPEGWEDIEGELPEES